MVAPQFSHEYLRLPPLAVFSMRSPHSGHAFWSCLMGSWEFNRDSSPDYLGHSGATMYTESQGLLRLWE